MTIDDVVAIFLDTANFDFIHQYLTDHPPYVPRGMRWAEVVSFHVRDDGSVPHYAGVGPNAWGLVVGQLHAHNYIKEHGARWGFLLKYSVIQKLRGRGLGVGFECWCPHCLGF
jgi:hypothetical protein